MPKYIEIRGARQNNLKNVSIDIPRDKLVVFTGLSGSGKSSLAFDTIYAEGQRRYVESLSTYARQFLGVMDKPDVDSIEGLSPTIVIDQRSGSQNPRSTVGTLTEVYDFLRILFARVGIPHCVSCGQEVRQQTVTEIIERMQQIAKQKKLRLIVPLIVEKKGDHKKTLEQLYKGPYQEIKIDKTILDKNELVDFPLDKKEKHTIEIVWPELISFDRPKKDFEEVIKQALDLGDGYLKAQVIDEEDEHVFTQYFMCPTCDIQLPTVEPRSFSFNSPQGACPACSGLGTTMVIDPELVIPNKKLTVNQGAIRPWNRVYANSNTILRTIEQLGKVHGFTNDTPIDKLSEKQLQTLLYGADGNGGIIGDLQDKYLHTDSEYVKKEIEQYMRVLVCPKCKGKRLQPHVLAVTIVDKNIYDLVTMTIDELKVFLLDLKSPKSGLGKKEQKIMSQLIPEVCERLTHLEDVGLPYLTMDRSAVTLSGGELQRIRLATQLGTSLTGIIYILDEPSIGLHPRDNEKLIESIKGLRDRGNTVIVVEHDQATMESADLIIDMGPGAGEKGGKIIAQGTAEELKNDSKSITGKYLSGKEEISRPKKVRKGSGEKITIHGATAFNLKDVTVDIPLGKFVAFTGVSGSGKSTLVTDILAKHLAHEFYRAKDLPADHKEITGTQCIDKVITIDQSPIGRTPRSNPATYTGVFTYIRDLFVEVPEAKLKGYKAGHFSFNVKQGRCEHCSGDGSIKIEMPLLTDVYVECEECHGRRYKKESLEVYFNGKNIADVLEMTVDEARVFFKNTSVIFDKLNTLKDVGLGYLRLGQSATTLSGGEAQRIKLATELSRRSTGKTLYILDEPTTGLHFEDIKKLLDVLNRLVDKGNTVLVIEHNLDVIKSCDWVVDMGPEGGANGGEVVAQGVPEDIAKEKRSYTGKYLKEIL